MQPCITAISFSQTVFEFAVAAKLFVLELIIFGWRDDAEQMERKPLLSRKRLKIAYACCSLDKIVPLA